MNFVNLFLSNIFSSCFSVALKMSCSELNSFKRFFAAVGSISGNPSNMNCFL